MPRRGYEQRGSPHYTNRRASVEASGFRHIINACLAIEEAGTEREMIEARLTKAQLILADLEATVQKPRRNSDPREDEWTRDRLQGILAGLRTQIEARQVELDRKGKRTNG